MSPQPAVSPRPLVWLLAALLPGIFLPVHAAYIYPRPVLARTIDVDADGRPDVEVRSGDILPGVFPVCFYMLPVGGVGLYGLNGTQLLTVGASCIPDLLPLTEGVAIGPRVHSESAWLAGGEAYSRQPIPGQEPLRWGPMVNLRTMYAGVRIPKPAGYRYGWIQLSSETEGSELRVLGLSAEARVETQLAAGQVLPPPPAVEEDPIVVGAEQRTIGGIRSERSTNSVSGSITTSIQLVHPPSVQVLVRNQAGVPEPLYLGPGTLLPATLPADWTWVGGGSVALPLRRTERGAEGGLLSDAGPLSTAAAGAIGMRTVDGLVWWVALNGDGGVVEVGGTAPTAPRLLVGQPSDTPGIPNGYLDLDRDGQVDFLYTQRTVNFQQPGGDPLVPGLKRSWWLIPLSGNRVLSPTTLPLRGGTISATPPEGANWQTNRVMLLEVTVTTGSFNGSFSNVSALGVRAGEEGYVGVDFASGTGRRLGWIRFNMHSTFTGRVAAGQAIYSHDIHVADFGAGSAPGEPVAVGANSAFPLGLGIAIEGDQLRVTWDLVARNATLESSRSIQGAVWERISTGEVHSQLLPPPADGGPLFLQMRLPMVYPAVH